MKIPRGRPTYHEISKVSSGIGDLKRVRPFVLKYTKVLSSHTLIIAALCGMARPNRLVRNFKNFKIVLSELSQNLSMILVPDFFLTRLVAKIVIRCSWRKQITEISWGEIIDALVH